MDLTRDEKSIVTSAYKAVVLEQPLISSNLISLRRAFNKVTIYINSASGDIRKAIIVAVTKKEELSIEMYHLKIERMKAWKEKISNIYYLFY